MEWLNKLSSIQVILASESPRRKLLLKEIGVNFQVVPAGHGDENYPNNLSNTEIPKFLASMKARSCSVKPDVNHLIIGADTIVCIHDRIINKPTDKADAVSILKTLSGNCHFVHTGVCILWKDFEINFHSTSEVHFKALTEEEINYYIDHYKPYDKAGAYGIQEWIGYIGIDKINGSFYNVMGLPIEKLYDELKKLMQ
jgi:septum formation protein